MHRLHKYDFYAHLFFALLGIAMAIFFFYTSYPTVGIPNKGDLHSASGNVVWIHFGNKYGIDFKLASSEQLYVYRGIDRGSVYEALQSAKNSQIEILFNPDVREPIVSCMKKCEVFQISLVGRSVRAYDQVIQDRKNNKWFGLFLAVFFLWVTGYALNECLKMKNNWIR